MKLNRNLDRKLNPLIIGGILLGILTIILLVFSIRGLMQVNPFGEETRIDNFDEIYENMKQNEKDLIFHQLYLTIAENLKDGQEVPTSGALIRAGTAENDYDVGTKVYTGKFVVDIESVEQTYQIQFEWAKDENNPNLGGYPVVVSCPPARLTIYSGGCVDEESGMVIWINDYQLIYTFGATKAETVKKMIENFWDDKSTNGYKMTVDETSLTSVKDEPDYTYRFDVNRENLSTGSYEWYTVTVWLENFANAGKVTVEVTKK